MGWYRSGHGYGIRKDGSAFTRNGTSTRWDRHPSKYGDDGMSAKIGIRPDASERTNVRQTRDSSDFSGDIQDQTR
jgi:hypothetical protein